MCVTLTRVRGLPIALALGLVATSCVDTAGSQPPPSSSVPALAPTASSPIASSPRPSPTASPSDATPVSSGAVPKAGVVYVWGADDGIYRYDGASGMLARVWGASTLARETADGPYVLGRHGGINLLHWDGTTEPKCPTGSFADLSVRGTCAFIGGDDAVYVDRGGSARMLLPADWAATSFAWSPDGAELAFIRSERRSDPVPALEPLWRSTLWHLDRRGALTKIFDSTNEMSSLFGLNWSFDRRLSVWESTTTSNSLAADGVGTTLYVVNVDTGASISLGTALGKRAWAQWSLDGRLAFVSGGGRETWGNKQLVVLERDGTRRIVAGDLGQIGGSATAAIAPAWQPIFGTPARLAWIEGPAGGIGASPDYFRALGPIAQRFAVLETLSGRLQVTCPGLVTEGVRWSADASAALLLCRAPGVEQHALQVRHGREVCIARRPHCSQCVLSSLCPRVGVVDAR